MLSFIKLSERRYLVVNVPEKPDSYGAAEGYLGKGYLSARAEMITTEPVSWSEAAKAAARWAAERKLLVTADDFQRFIKEGRPHYEYLRDSL